LVDTYHASVDGLVIRQARPGDGKGLADLHLDTAASLRLLDPSRFRLPDADGMAEWIDGDLATVGGDWCCFVAVEEDRIVGQIEAKLHAPLDSARYQTIIELENVRGEVNSLGVLSSHRRRGIGQALMAAAEEWLKARGARVVILDTFLRSQESCAVLRVDGVRTRIRIFERDL
jgi:ribosomal protein S18 acetylase RimI-like enzyme